MRVHVLHHVVLANESFAALDAGERLAAAMQAHVSTKIRLVIERLCAFQELALERLVTAMLRYVFLVRGVARESLAASLTFERLFATMERLVVLRQVARLVEHFITNVATVVGRR